MMTDAQRYREHDIGLRFWLESATEGLRDDARERVRQEATEHFVAMIEELCRSGLDERAARAEALERLGDPRAAQLQLLKAHFPHTSVPRSWDGTPSIPADAGWLWFMRNWAVVPVSLLIGAALFAAGVPLRSPAFGLFLAMLGCAAGSIYAGRSGRVVAYVTLRLAFWLTMVGLYWVAPDSGTGYYLIFTPVILMDAWSLFQRYPAVSGSDEIRSAPL